MEFVTEVPLASSNHHQAIKSPSFLTGGVTEMLVSVGRLRSESAVAAPLGRDKKIFVTLASGVSSKE